MCVSVCECESECVCVSVLGEVSELTGAPSL